MSLVLEALDREIEFFEFFEDVMVSRVDSAALIYQSIKDKVSMYTNDIERISAIEELSESLVFGTAGCDLLDEFLTVNTANYVLNYQQTVQAVKTLKGLDYDGIANEMYSMSMTCDPTHLKEILAKQA